MVAANLSGRTSRPLHYYMHGYSARQSKVQLWLVLGPRKGGAGLLDPTLSLRQPRLTTSCP